MNGSLIFVLSVVSVVMLAGIAKEWIKQKNRTDDTGAELEETLSKMEQLEERIKVLERIITENKFDLKEEIDSL